MGWTIYWGHRAEMKGKLCNYPGTGGCPPSGAATYLLLPSATRRTVSYSSINKNKKRQNDYECIYSDHEKIRTNTLCLCCCRTRGTSVCNVLVTCCNCLSRLSSRFTFSIQKSRLDSTAAASASMLSL